MKTILSTIAVIAASTTIASAQSVSVQQSYIDFLNNQIETVSETASVLQNNLATSNHWASVYSGRARNSEAKYEEIAEILGAGHIHSTNGNVWGGEHAVTVYFANQLVDTLSLTEEKLANAQADIAELASAAVVDAAALVAKASEIAALEVEVSDLEVEIADLEVNVATLGVTAAAGRSGSQALANFANSLVGTSGVIHGVAEGQTEAQFINSNIATIEGVLNTLTATIEASASATGALALTQGWAGYTSGDLAIATAPVTGNVAAKSSYGFSNLHIFSTDAAPVSYSITTNVGDETLTTSAVVEAGLVDLGTIIADVTADVADFAYDAGFDDGFDAGFKAGFTAGYTQAYNDFYGN